MYIHIPYESIRILLVVFKVVDENIKKKKLECSFYSFYLIKLISLRVQVGIVPKSGNLLNIGKSVKGFRDF